MKVRPAAYHSAATLSSDIDGVLDGPRVVGGPVGGRSLHRHLGRGGGSRGGAFEPLAVALAAIFRDPAIALGIMLAAVLPVRAAIKDKRSRPMASGRLFGR